MTRQLVSVIIPCYKQAHLVGRALSSVLAQTWRPLEIIVVDDGSPDDVAGAVEPFGDEVIYVRKENQGLSAARNTGLAHATGEFVKFLDSDDWLLPGCIEEQAEALTNLENFISIIGFRLHFEENPDFDHDLWPNFGSLRQTLCFCNPGPPHIYFYHRKSLLELGGFDTSERTRGGHEDYDLICRMAARGYEAVVSHSIGCVYRKAPGSMSQHKENMRRTRVAVFSEYAESLLAREDLSAEDLVACAGGYLRMYLSDAPPPESRRIIDVALDRLQSLSPSLSGANFRLLADFAELLRLEWPGPGAADEYHQGAREILDSLQSLLRGLKERLGDAGRYDLRFGDPRHELRTRLMRLRQERVRAMGWVDNSLGRAGLCEWAAKQGYREVSVLGTSEESRMLCRFLEVNGVSAVSLVVAEKPGPGETKGNLPVVSVEEALSNGARIFISPQIPTVEEELKSLSLLQGSYPGTKVFSKGALFEKLVDMARRLAEAEGSKAIYGAGAGGRILGAIAQGMGLEVEAFVDKNPNLQGTTLQGRPVISIDEARERAIKNLAIGSLSYLAEIKDSLCDYFLRNDYRAELTMPAEALSSEKLTRLWE